jgi:putative spermidine/putrescine transport system substrate-binding protein
MRWLWVALCLLAAPAVIGQAVAQAPAENRVVIATFGGLLGKLVRENVELYTKPLGIQAVFVEAASADILAKVRAQRSAPQYDLALLNDQTFVVAKSLGLIQKLDPAEVPNVRQLRPGLLDGYGAPYEINPVGWIYRRDKLAAAGVPAPATWRAVADKRLAGRVVMFNFSSFYTVLTMAGLQLSAGKTVADDSEIWPFMQVLYDNRMIVVAAPGQAEELAKSGEAWVYPGTAQRALLLKDQGVDVGFAPAADALLSLTNYMVPIARAPHPVNAQRVLNWILGPEIQARMARQGAIVPVNASVALEPALMERLGFGGAAEVPAFRVLDVETVNEKFGAWSEGFDKVMSRPR